MKPMLASDYSETKLRFPLLVQPKIDGVRALNMNGVLTGRSLKTHKNRHVTALLSHPSLIGFDGEIAAQRETHPDLCRLTTSVLSTVESDAFVLWWLFDYITHATKDKRYDDRFAIMRERVFDMQHKYPHIHQHLRIIPSKLVHSIEELLELDTIFLDAGYEGTIVRDPAGLHKPGRSTVREGGLLRIKRFLDGEAEITGVTEGESNQNEAKINELGLTERSTHQANMVPNGMVGTIQGIALADVGDVIKKGQELTVAAGRMTADERRLYFENPRLITGQIMKFKFFPKGVKDKPRFPTFQSLRAKSDISAGDNE